MALGLTKSRVSPIAIDFGADTIKMLQITPGDPPEMVAAAARELPEAARKDPAARLAFCHQALGQMLKDGAFKGRRVMLSIPAFQTLVQHFQVAKVDGANELAEQIGMSLRHRLNVDPTRMVIRHFPVLPITRDGHAKLEVICIAASRESVMRYIDIANRCKLEVVGMHAEPPAILRAFSHLCTKQNQAEQTTCFVDIGAATTKVVVAHGDQMVFSKMIHAAGDHFTRHLARADGVDFEEERKRRLGQWTRSEVGPAAARAGYEADLRGKDSLGLGLATLETPATAAHHEAQPSKRFNEGIAETLSCLVDEIKMSLRYHKNLFPERNIDKLVFLGGESRHVATCKQIARQLCIGAQLGDPLARVARLNRVKTNSGVDMTQPQPGWAVPMGLCLSEANL
jgi:type IV pilus assembly protein PilM